MADQNALLDKLGPTLVQLEQLRLEKRATHFFRMKMVVGLAVAVGLWALWLERQYVPTDFETGMPAHEFLLASAFFLAGPIIWWMMAPVWAYRKIYKQRVFPDIANAYGLRYVLRRKMTAADFRPARIVPLHKECVSEHFFEGQYKGANIRFSAITLKTNGGKDRKTETLFQGLGVIIELNQVHFLGHTIVVEDGGTLNEWAREKLSDLKRADLVDPVFEKKYSVFTTDQVEARYLIDPLMIERINHLRQPSARTHGTLAVAYRDGAVYVMLPADGVLFKPVSIAIPATEPRMVLALHHHIGDLLGMIDQLEFYQPPQK